MNISLSTLAAALSSVVTVAQGAEKLYTYAGTLVDAAEKAYADVPNAGASKKAAVLAAVEALASTLGLEWTNIVAELSAWIDNVKATYNLLTGRATTAPA